MEKYLIHSNELHLIDQERIHQAVEQMVESLDMAPDLHFSLTFIKVGGNLFQGILDKRREINHLLGITDNTYDPTEDFGVC